jgi:hypothetical protein
MSQSQAGEVLVSCVVTDLVAGAGLKVTERRSFELKGPQVDGICLRRACRFWMISSLGPTAEIAAAGEPSDGPRYQRVDTAHDGLGGTELVTPGLKGGK